MWRLLDEVPIGAIAALATSTAVERVVLDDSVVVIDADPGRTMRIDAGLVTGLERKVFLTDAPSNNRLRLHFHGQDVTTDIAGCGYNSMLVYYAAFYEDSDRESAENLDAVRPE